jgi:hypothetical protein
MGPGKTRPGNADLVKSKKTVPRIVVVEQLHLKQKTQIFIIYVFLIKDDLCYTDGPPWLRTSCEIIKQRNCFHMKNLIIALSAILTLNVIQATSFVSNVRSLASNHILDNTTMFWICRRSNPATFSLQS